MLKTWIAVVLNFFFSGLGYVVLGHNRLLGVGWTLGALGLTYVELGIQTAAPSFYLPMFASVFLINTCFAIDAYRVGKRLAKEAPAQSPAPA